MSGANLADVIIYDVNPAEFESSSIASADRFQGSLAIEAGRPVEAISFYYEKGMIENPRFLIQTANAGMTPLTGSISISDEGTITSHSGVEGALRIRGEMLLTGAELTAQGFNRGLPGKWGNYIVTITGRARGWAGHSSRGCCWARSIVYTFGLRWSQPYRVVYVGFIFHGSILTVNMVWTLADIAMGCMAVQNLIAIIALSGLTARITRDYNGRYRGE